MKKLIKTIKLKLWHLKLSKIYGKVTRIKYENELHKYFQYKYN